MNSSVYEIEYRYADEYAKSEPTHNCYVCVYDTATTEGETIQYALDLANEDDDWSGVDKLMTRLFGLKDEDICFYFDLADIKYDETSRLTKLVPELQKEFGIVIKNIWIERSSDE